MPDRPHDLAFHVNRHGVLAIPASLWLAFALLARQWLLLVAVAVSQLRRQTDTSLLLGDGGVPWFALVAQLPVLLLMLAAANRLPGAGGWARLLWRRGREIVVLTAAFNLVWTGKLLLASGYWSLWPELFLACCSLIDLAIVLAVYTTPYHRQMFAEFPARDAPQ
ncbi:MAG TPA: DUF2919 family protein [Nevskiaceae bacterium]|nr:DUF2919 family protein [Nevskiaceae bacterium]